MIGLHLNEMLGHDFALMSHLILLRWRSRLPGFCVLDFSSNSRWNRLKSLRKIMDLLFEYFKNHLGRFRRSIREFAALRKYFSAAYEATASGILR